MSTSRMMSVRSLILRLNYDRNSRKTSNTLGSNNLWLTERQLVVGTEKFIKLSGYQKIEFNQTFNQGGYQFTSPIVGYRSPIQDHLSETQYWEHSEGYTRLQNQEAEPMEDEHEHEIEKHFIKRQGRSVTTIVISTSRLASIAICYAGETKISLLKRP